ncbi:MAG TPA: DUF4124 domain-containing protein [Gammaproteobacteria bacterium]|nr:DUF4124 domain-containing protein [Gammaproteobacteria bacterium]
MAMNITRFLQVMLAVLSGAAVLPASSMDISSGISKSYSTKFMQKDGTENAVSENVAQPQIYKFTDNHGKITYSTVITPDFIEAEEVLLQGPPSRRYIEETEQINGELKAAAQQLANAREQRQALRDAKEKKRLERLALINRSKPPVVYPYPQNNYVAWPYRYGAAVHYSGYRPHKKPKPVHLPAGAHPRGFGASPPSFGGGISYSHHR